jgi:hypothetical protein
MRANASIGELIISTTINEKAVDLFFRPSFSALNSLGSPDDIDEIIRGCFDAMTDCYSYLALLPCIAMIGACIDDDLTDEFYRLFGEIEFNKKNSLSYKSGAITPSEIIIIANHLVKWGVIGNPKKKGKPSKEKTNFDPSEYVGAAIAHLGLSKSDAWGLTMTEFQRAIESKFPSQDDKAVKDSQDINQSEYDSLMAKHDEIMRKRAEQLKS